MPVLAEASVTCSPIPLHSEDMTQNSAMINTWISLALIVMMKRLDCYRHDHSEEIIDHMHTQKQTL